MNGVFNSPCGGLGPFSSCACLLFQCQIQSDLGLPKAKSTWCEMVLIGRYLNKTPVFVVRDMYRVPKIC